MKLARLTDADAVDAMRQVDQPLSAERDGRHWPTAEGSTSAPQFQQLTSILRRRAGLIFTVTACGAMLAGVLGLLIPPKYTAVAQIIALPGGNDPVFASTDLRSENQPLWAEFAKEQAHVWRLKSELGEENGLDKDGLTDLPLPKSTVSEIVGRETQYLQTRQADYQREKAFLNRSIKEGEEQIVVLSEQQQKEEEGTQADAEELRKAIDLVGKGTVTAPRMTDARRAVLLSSTRKLQTTAQLMQVRRQQDELSRRLEKLDDQRRIELLRELQNASARLSEIRVKLHAVEPSQPGVPPRPTEDTISTQIDTHVVMVTSHDLLQRVLDSLAELPEFRTIVPKKSAPGAGATAWDAVSPATPALAGPSATENGELSTNEFGHRLATWIDALARRLRGNVLDIEELERRLKASQEGRSRIIGVRFTSTSPERAAAVANQVAQLYVGGRREQNRAYFDFEWARLDKRIAELKRVSHSTNQEEAQAEVRELNSLLRRQQDIRDQGESVSSDARILSLASPPRRPSSPNPILFILPAMIAFLIGGSLLAVLVERLDRGLRSERDVTAALGIPCIGLLPQVRLTARTRPHQCLLKKPFSAYTEAIRSVAAELQLVTPQGAHRTILVSSSVRGEGRTTVAVSLAVYLAQLGRRVLLVDLDFRHPSISRELGGQAEADDAGARSRRNSPPADVIQRIQDLKVDYLPMYRGAIEPLALFVDERMSGLLRQLREKYDCVIIDGPPLQGGAEARVLAAFADKVLFVVKWGSTRPEVAQNALRLLRNAGRSPKESIELPSAVVTQVDLKKHARYQYGDASEAWVRTSLSSA